MCDEDKKESNGLDVVFKKLKVDKSWNGIARSNDVLPESSPGGVFKGKITKRSPAKDKDVESKSHHSKRAKPYERDDLPFGDDGLERLTFRSEECSNAKCTCNRKHRTRTKSGDNLLNFAIACKSPQSSPERKVIKDSKFKLHHKEKDHKVVLRAARLKLHRLNWYKGPVLKRGTLSKSTTFGDNSVVKTDFSSVAKAPPKWEFSSHLEQNKTFSGLSFTQQQRASKTIVRPKQTGAGNSSTQSLRSHTSCSCSPPQSVLPNQNKPKSTISTKSSSREICELCRCVENEAKNSLTPPGATSTGGGSFSGGSSSSSRINRKRPSSSPRSTASCCPIHPAGQCVRPCGCAEQARMDSTAAASAATDYSVDELASYLDEYVYIPKKMSEMAEMMYT